MDRSVLILLGVWLLAVVFGSDEPYQGYLLYCPCMGRFGNQADQMLGVMALAKGLKRTLVLPPWVEYSPGQRKPNMVPWDTYFQVEAVQKHAPAITMEEFIGSGSQASKIWPEEERAAFCYSARQGKEEESCNAKEGSPFGPFWDNFNITFNHSELYGPLHYDVHHGDTAHAWSTRFPSSRYPVIAFTGAPAAFPVQQQNLPLQQFVVWQEKWKSRARTWLQQNLPPGPFVGVHLRNGGDWVRACEHVDKGLEQLFSSPQCLGYRGEHGKLTKELCLPSLANVARQVRRAAKEVKAVAVFVASDSDHLLDQLRNELRTTRLSFHKQESNPPDTQLDLVILGQSNIFIGNCVSSFSAFVARGRAVHGLPTQFFGFPQKNDEEKSNIHTEL